MDRQEGYYWVTFKGIIQIAYYKSTGIWLRIDSLLYYEDSDLEHINENRIKQPGELPD